MHEPLTAAEYKAIARSLTLPTNAFIDGAFRPAASGKTFATTNPATGETLAQIAACDAADVDYAVSKARDAFDDGRWSRLAPADRKAVLLKFAKRLEENRHELAVMESLDSGKPIRECQTVDVPDTIHTIRWHAELIDKLYDNTAPAGQNVLAMVVREPVGVVGCVLPWNFPLLMLAWKIGPALAAGCSVIVKPAEDTTLTALRVAELALEAGIPAGVFNVLTGTGKDVGEPTIVEGVKPDSKLFQEEIFGPILGVTTFRTLAEAVALANDTNYGLAASVYTGSLRKAIRLSREIKAGVVTINCFGEGDASTPFGGYKESGFGGRDKSVFAHDNYCELKTIWIDVSDRADETIR